MYKFLNIFLFIAFIGTIFPQEKLPETIKIQLSQLDNDSNKIDFLLEKCEQYRKNLKTDTAISIGQYALEISRNNDFNSRISKSYNFIGLCYRDLARFLDARRQYSHGLEYALLSKDTLQIAYSYYNIGGLERILSNYIEAVQLILTAQSYFKAINNKGGIAHCSTNLGLLYKTQKQYSEAVKHFTAAAKIRKGDRDTIGYAMSTFMLGETYSENGDLNKSLKYYISADSILNSTKEKYYIYRATIYMGLASIYYELKDYDISLQFRIKALIIIEKAQKKHELIMIYNAIGKIYTRKHEFDKAKKFFDKALFISKETDLDIRRLEVYYSYSDFYNEQEEFQKAFEYLTKYSQLKDTLLKGEDQARIARIEARFQANEKEKQTEALKLKLENTEIRNRSWIVVALSFFLLLSFIFYKYKSGKNANRKLQDLNQTKDLLFSIISHDIRNPFSAVVNHSDMLKKDFDNLSDDDIKESIHSINRASHNISDLLENLLQWAKSHWGEMKIEKQNFDVLEMTDEMLELYEHQIANKSIKIKKVFSEKLRVYADKNTFKIILRNLLSNAVKFSNPGGEIEMDFSRESGFVKIKITDNGVGMDKESVDKLFKLNIESSSSGTIGEKGYGLGLVLCHEFVTKNGGKIDVISAPGKGTTFSFTTPLARE